MIIVLTGATGSGKSELAITLARQINGEIVNSDAFQVYEGIKIATASPTDLEKASAPHHLYNFVSLNEGYDIAKYQVDARKKIEEILARGKTPILVGGSGLYIRSALYDYDLSIDTSNVDMSKYEEMSNEELHCLLKELDPTDANKIPYQNRRRLLRSIAICLASGESKTSLIAKQNHEPIYDHCFFFAIKMEREEIYKRIDRRVDSMFSSGLLEETCPLIKKYGKDKPAFQAIGVKELIPYLEKKVSLEETINQIKLDTRHYVKRQETFFRHQFPIQYINSVEDILSLIK